MIFDTTPVGQIDTNCYLIGDEEAGVCAVADPGGSPERGGKTNSTWTCIQVLLIQPAS